MKNNESKLFGVAEEQQGYFTTKQATACGYVNQNHRHHVLTGAWVRVHRGIYRLSRFPSSQDEQYVLWALWSRNRNDEPQGVYSHQTALSIHELSDLMPAKLHMTVPPGFRRNSALPRVIILHRAILHESDIMMRQGYRVVRPLRAIVDLLHDGVESCDHLRQALQQGLERGLIIQTEFRQHPESAALNELLGRSQTCPQTACRRGSRHAKKMTIANIGIRDLSMRFNSEQMNKIHEACRRFNVRKLFVFGSCVSGTFSEDSDVDFLVDFVRHGFAGAFDQYLGLKEELELITGRRVDLVCVSGIRNPIFKQESESTRELVYAA